MPLLQLDPPALASNVHGMHRQALNLVRLFEDREGIPHAAVEEDRGEMQSASRTSSKRGLFQSRAEVEGASRPGSKQPAVLNAVDDLGKKTASPALRLAYVGVLTTSNTHLMCQVPSFSCVLPTKCCCSLCCRPRRHSRLNLNVHRLAYTTLTKVQELLSSLDLLHCFCNRGLAQRHWSRISELVGLPIEPESLTLQRVLWDRNGLAYPHRTGVRPVSDQCHRVMSRR